MIHSVNVGDHELGNIIYIDEMIDGLLLILILTFFLFYHVSVSFYYQLIVGKSIHLVIQESRHLCLLVWALTDCLSED